MNVAAEWLRSGECASLDGIELVPLAYPDFASVPISLVRGQATAYVLQDRQSRGWILKKFLPGRDPELTYVRAIRGLVPHRAGFESGSQRRVLASHAVGRGFDTPAFVEWIEKTILMPRVCGMDWLSLSDAVRQRTITLGDEARTAMCKSLVSLVRALEDAGLSHRDLSISNVFIDPSTWDVHLIDWDVLYHASLSIPANTTVGSAGYTAPFLMTGTGEDAWKSWCPYADRFAMALLCAEFLLLDHLSEITHEGGLLEQTDLYARHGPTVRRVVRDLERRYPAIGRLFNRSLQAPSFATCPSPDEWLAAPPLVTAIPAPALPDRNSVMRRFDMYVEELKRPSLPIPPAPALPLIDFSAVIRETLAPHPHVQDERTELEETED